MSQQSALVELEVDINFRRTGKEKSISRIVETVSIPAERCQEHISFS